jgi:hypothetical protein
MPVDRINTKPAETAAQHRDDTNSLRLVINKPRFENGQARGAKEHACRKQSAEILHGLRRRVTADRLSKCFHNCR